MVLARSLRLLRVLCRIRQEVEEGSRWKRSCAKRKMVVQECLAELTEWFEVVVVVVVVRVRAVAGLVTVQALASRRCLSNI